MWPPYFFIHICYVIVKMKSDKLDEAVHEIQKGAYFAMWLHCISYTNKV